MSNGNSRACTSRCAPTQACHLPPSAALRRLLPPVGWSGAGRRSGTSGWYARPRAGSAWTPSSATCPTRGERSKLLAGNSLGDMTGSLNERERQVLEAVIETYVETAEPAGSRTISKKFGHTLSAATIRNTMSDLEEKGYLYHPHTSAGRIPTDLAYRVYVNSLMRLSQVSASDSHQIREELAERNAVDQILERAAQVLGVL